MKIENQLRRLRHPFTEEQNETIRAFIRGEIGYQLAAKRIGVSAQNLPRLVLNSIRLSVIDGRVRADDLIT